MLVLLLANNLFTLLLRWEGVRLTSYLLINFWSTRVSALKASLKALLLNRLRDIRLVLALLSSQSAQSSFHLWENPTYCALLIRLAVTAKSAQLRLHSWLADAMERPTPVSALLHAATMVTAGVYLIVRTSALWQQTLLGREALLLLRSGTILMARTLGIASFDLKKVIAYSTSSQLRYMVLAAALAQYGVAQFHLLNHGLFKGLLFLSARTLIHSTLDEQDIRRLSVSPNAFNYVFRLAQFTLIRLPFLARWWSKEAILEARYTSPRAWSLAPLIRVTLTALYSAKLTLILTSTG